MNHYAAFFQIGPQFIYKSPLLANNVKYLRTLRQKRDSVQASLCRVPSRLIVEVYHMTHSVAYIRPTLQPFLGSR